MNIILLGPPGAGKGTQGSLISEYFEIAHITTGNALRINRDLKTEYGTPRSFMDRGELVPDSVVNEIVEVEKELSRLRAEIDSLKGRFKFIENSVVTSLVHIYMEEIPNPVSINDPSWNTRDIALDAIKALSSFGQFLVSVIVFIFVFTPVWILIAGLIYGTKKLRNRNK